MELLFKTKKIDFKYVYVASARVFMLSSEIMFAQRWYS